jgi:hypothetical protein
MTSEIPTVSLTNILFAPTNKGADRACLEVGSGYNFKLQSAQVYALDFCDGTAEGTLYTMKTIDSSFRSLYERDFGDGLPSYFYEVVRTVDGHWTAYLYDYTDGLWLPFYTSVRTMLNTIPAAVQGNEGWDIFESHYYAVGSCPFVPEVHSFGKQYFDMSTSSWRYLEYEPGATFDIPATQLGTDCLESDDGTGVGYFYSIGYNAPLHDWTVDAYPSLRPPPGGGGGDPGCDPAVQDCCGSDPVSCFCFNQLSCCELYDSSCCPSGFTSTHCTDAITRDVSNERRRAGGTVSFPWSGPNRGPETARVGGGKRAP